SAFVLDFDLHTGDGNINILGMHRSVLKSEILNPISYSEAEYLKEIENKFAGEGKYDIITASAGFDEYVLDWGGKLSTEAYKKIGKMMKDFSEDKCQGRRYALLEGGYYFEDLGKNVFSFCEGFK
ncbi:MAG: histone deacetylase family protein, partial [Promethearchaeota archaeon]